MKRQGKLVTVCGFLLPALYNKAVSNREYRHCIHTCVIPPTLGWKRERSAVRSRKYHVFTSSQAQLSSFIWRRDNHSGRGVENTRDHFQKKLRCKKKKKKQRCSPHHTCELKKRKDGGEMQVEIKTEMEEKQAVQGETERVNIYIPLQTKSESRGRSD